MQVRVRVQLCSARLHLVQEMLRSGGARPARAGIRGNGELKISPLKIRGVRGVMKEWRGSSPLRSGGACPRLEGDTI